MLTEAAYECSDCVEYSNFIYRISLLSDLHLSRKTGRVKRALEKAFESDCVLISGDLVNDGKPEQLEFFAECVNNTAKDKVPFAVLTPPYMI